MAGEIFDGASLEEALLTDSLTTSAAVQLIGMVKPSEVKGFIAFTRAGCDHWMDIPTNMIEKAEHRSTTRCKEHSHPVLALTLKEPKDPEAKILLALLAQPSPMPMAMPGGGIPTRHMPMTMPGGVRRRQRTYPTRRAMMSRELGGWGLGGWGGSEWWGDGWFGDGSDDPDPDPDPDPSVCWTEVKTVPCGSSGVFPYTDVMCTEVWQCCSSREVGTVCWRPA